MKSGDRSHFSTSSHFGAYTATVEDGRLVDTAPFPKDPDPSPLIQSIPGAVHHKCRIEQPMVRKGWLDNGPQSAPTPRGGEPFVPVSWDKALDLVAAEVDRVKRDHGSSSIYAGSYGWGSAGIFHFAASNLHRFFALHGGYTKSVDSYSQACVLVLTPHILGKYRHNTWPVIAEHGRLVVMFGGMALKNSYVEYGGCGEHVVRDGLRAARDAGVEFVNIGPLRDDAADFLKAEYVFARPNTDTAVMLGLAHTLVAEGLHDQAYLNKYSVGFDKFEPYLMGDTDGQPKSAEWAAGISGLDPETIRALARRMAATPTLITTSLAVQRQDHGEQPLWMATTLAAMLGQIGLPGAGVGFAHGALNGVGNPSQKIVMSGLPKPENPIDDFIPVARIADLLLNPGQTIDYNGRKLTFPDTRLVYWCGGNPFHHHQDLNRLLEAWQRPETIIVNEPWWNALARHADIVLPATTALERNDIGASIAGNDRFVLAMQKAVEPVGSARNDHDIFAGLAGRLGFGDAFTEGRTEMEWLRHLYDVSRQQIAGRGHEMPDFDTFWDQGYVEFPPDPEPKGMLQDFHIDPAANPLTTPSGKVEIFSDRIDSFGYDDCPGHATWIEPAERLGSAQAEVYPLHMVSNQPKTRLHSQLDMGPVSGATKVRGREPMQINSVDAAARGLNDGDVVRIFNDRGACLAGVNVTDEVMPSVIKLSTGAWFDPVEPGVIGSLDKHGNPNMLTLDKGTSRLAQGPTSHTALVEVERYDGDLPPVTAFEPPEILAPLVE
ncbi:MAG: molybdopterin-dependent oxidoreductase [Rhodospirillales bacterium]|nr:molybdopterin-dependent oxidoreductase [Rhodospirillales bacterium]